MESFDRLEELNSIEPTRAIMVEVEHNKGAYHKWYKRKTHTQEGSTLPTLQKSSSVSQRITPN
jgi:hypothetical protein